jgi:hypothetical protein
MFYRIYYVVGVKVGCTVQTVEARCRYQNLWEGYVVEILEIIPLEFGAKFAGNQERFWQWYYRCEEKENTHYERNWGTNLTPERRSEVARTTSGFATGAAGRASLASPKHTSKTGRTGMQTIVKCPYCPKEGRQMPMKRWHFNNCPELKKMYQRWYREYSIVTPDNPNLYYVD